ncbi:MAG: hypothetical protein VW268_09770 [Rhodospirillaceae bacterium]
MSASPQSPLRVLVLSGNLDAFVLRQTPNNDGRWGNCEFHINSPDGAYDRVVVYDNCPRAASVICPPDGTLMLVGEPPEVKHYHPGFLRQFARVASPDGNTPHPRLIDTQCGQPWFVGMASKPDGSRFVNMDYAALARAQPEKTGLLSIVVGRTGLTEGHRMRARLAEILQDRLGSDVGVFGHMVNRVDDKSDALAPFKYHVALENGRYPHYWTEKLADAYLADCFPFYWGCMNTADYFDPAGFRTINIYDPESAADVIQTTIEAGAYEATRDARQRDKRRIMEEYNLFALMDRLISAPTAEPACPLAILPERQFIDSPLRKFRHRLKRAVPRSIRPRRWKV